MKKIILLPFLFAHWLATVAQNNPVGVLLIVKKQCSGLLRVSYYDSALNANVLGETENPSDTVFIEQQAISSIGGFTSFGDPQAQFDLLTLPGDSMVVTCKKNGFFDIRFLNKGPLYRIRERERTQWLHVVDDTCLAKMLRYKKQKDLPRFIETYREGHAKRLQDLTQLYKGYTHLEWYRCKVALEAFTQNSNLFREKFDWGGLDTTDIQQQLDSLVALANNPLLINLPKVRNTLAVMLQKLTRYKPAYYTNSYWFNYVARHINPGPLQNKLLLYYVARTQSRQWYDTLAARYLALYPDAKAEIEKTRKLKFLNLNSVQSCNVTDTTGSILSFDSLVAQYRGKPLYIDFWASWCAPCIAEMPQSKKLRERYMDKVQFLYISVDDTPEQWLGSIQRNKLQGAAHYLLPDALFVYKGTKLRITGVPQHMLMDAEGNWIDDKAPGPSDKLLPKALESLIK